MSGKIQLRSRFNTTGFSGNQKLAATGFQLDQTEIHAVCANNAVDHNVVYASDANFTAVCRLQLAGAIRANAFRPGNHTAARRHQNAASSGQTSPQVDGFVRGQRHI